ncbi:MAG: MFS transporter [Gemmatimonadaceae bacterium]
MTGVHPPPPATWLARLGLDRPELRGWAMYDWANSAMVAIVVTAVFPIYFSGVAGGDLDPAVATFRFGVATTIGLGFVAIVAPFLGAIADHAPVKKRMLAASLAIGATACALMFLIQRGDWLLAAVLFVVANIGANASYVFYDSLLPHVARRDEIDRVSTAGYALGYLGGGLILGVALAMIQRPEWFGLPAGDNLTQAEATLPARLAFVAVAIWWVAFSLPLFLKVREPAIAPRRPDDAGRGVIAIASSRIGRTFRELRGYRQAFLMLLAFLIYNDGIGTIVRMAGIYGAELGIGRGALIGSILLVQFVGIPFAFLFGMIAGRIGAKRSIFIGLVAYCSISMIGYFMQTALHFLLLAILVGMVQGGTQALSRSLFASMIPQHKSGEFFGFFAVFEKFAGILGPAVFAGTIALTGSSRNAILSVVAFFIVGGILLHFVDVDEGQRAARAAEERALNPLGAGAIGNGFPFSRE